MLRKTVRVIALVEGGLLLAIIIIAVTSNSDPAGDAMAMAFGTLAGLALLLFVIPALLAVRSNRFLRVALALVSMPAIVILASLSGIA